MVPLQRLGALLALALLVLAASAPRPGQDPKKELQAIDKELQLEYRHLREATKEAGNDEDAAALYREFQASVLPDFAARYRALALANKGTAAALPCWIKVLELTTQGLSGELPAEALRALTTEHLQSEELASLAGTLRYSTPALGEEASANALRALAEGSPHRKVQAAALYNLGAVLGDERPAGDARIAEAKSVLAKLATYADIEFRDGRSYAAAAEAFVFALDNLVVGKPCPDFTAIDAEGVAFKLSDYKGKVVLIDFWGFW